MMDIKLRVLFLVMMDINLVIKFSNEYSYSQGKNCYGKASSIIKSREEVTNAAKWRLAHCSSLSDGKRNCSLTLKLYFLSVWLLRKKKDYDRTENCNFEQACVPILGILSLHLWKIWSFFFSIHISLWVRTYASSKLSFLFSHFLSNQADWNCWVLLGTPIWNIGKSETFFSFLACFE